MTISLSNVNAQRFQAFFEVEYEGAEMLRGTTLEVHGVGFESYNWPVIGNTTMQPRGAPQSLVPASDVSHENIVTTMRKFILNLPTDKFQQAAVLPNELQALAREQAMAIGRTTDQVKIDTMVGNAGFTVPTNASNLTVDKLRQTLETFKKNNVPTGNLVFLMSAEGEKSLLESTEVTSHDFNTIRALVNGEINTFLGMRFITMGDRLEGGIPKTGNIRSSFAWDMNAVGTAWNRDPAVNTEFKTDQDTTVTVGVVGLGASVIKEEGVVQIDYDETL